MIDYAQAIDDLMNIHGKIAHEAFLDGGTLVCAKCGHSQLFTEQQAATYLRDGFPKHCDHDMSVVKCE